MIPRRTWVGIFTALILTGMVQANPPGEGGPLSEGRELDPVTRDYYLPVPTNEPNQNRAPARTANKPGDTASGFFAVVEAIRRSGRMGVPRR